MLTINGTSGDDNLQGGAEDHTINGLGGGMTTCTETQATTL